MIKCSDAHSLLWLAIGCKAEIHRWFSTVLTIEPDFCQIYCGWLRNPASPNGWLKPERKNNGMFTTSAHQSSVSSSCTRENRPRINAPDLKNFEENPQHPVLYDDLPIESGHFRGYPVPFLDKATLRPRTSSHTRGPIVPIPRILESVQSCWSSAAW